MCCGVSAFKQSRGDRPGLAGGELDAHVGVALTFRELQLDEAGAGFGVQGGVQAGPTYSSRRHRQLANATRSAQPWRPRARRLMTV